MKRISVAVRITELGIPENRSNGNGSCHRIVSKIGSGTVCRHSGNFVGIFPDRFNSELPGRVTSSWIFRGLIAQFFLTGNSKQDDN